MSYIKFNFYEFKLKNYFNNHFLIFLFFIKNYHKIINFQTLLKKNNFFRKFKISNFIFNL